MPLPQHVLAIAAHPDDIELTCAGTLAKFIACGTTVSVAIVCRGDRGGSGSQLAQVRESEAKAACALMNVEPTFLHAPDADVADSPELRQKLIAVLRETQPDLVLVHDPNDYHHDHRVVSEVSVDCCWFAASAGHATEPPTAPLPLVPAVMYYDTIAGIEFNPTHLVDITQQMKLKREMLACHQSQCQRDDSGMNQLHELQETLSRMRGLQCGTTFAEGFRPCPRFGRRRAEPIFP